MTEECVVELTWWRTWPDRQFDFSAADGDLRVGRVTMVGERGNKWQWYMYALVGKRHATVSGLADEIVPRFPGACRHGELGRVAERRHRHALSVLILKSGSFYAFASRVRRQKRWMLARMSSAVLVQRKGFGSALVASM